MTENTISLIDSKILTPKGNQINLHFFFGAHIDVIGKNQATYQITFCNQENGIILYTTKIDKNSEATYWCEPLIKYYIPWLVKITEDGIALSDFKFDVSNKKIWIKLSSNALGDTLAWFPFIDEFRKKHHCEVHVSTFHNKLFKENYPQLIFHEPGEENLQGYFAAYDIGAFDNDYSKNKNNWRTVPLQQVASDLLGLQYEEIKPKVVNSKDHRPIPEKYVAIAQFSTFDCKEWLNPGGWQKVVDYLISKNLKVISVAKEETNLLNVIKAHNKPIEETIRNIQYAEFFIGISSGCSWLSWGLNVPTVLISGPTLPFVEMKDCYRVINHSVCHGCMNDKDATFDRGNRRLCPKNNNLECSTSISPEMVISAIDRLLMDKQENKHIVQNTKTKQKILFITPHCSTGGLPQYLYASVRDLYYIGNDVAVIEYENIAGIYDVQKKKIKKISNFYTLGQNKDLELKQIIKDFEPDIIHLEEFPEYFLSKECIDIIYHTDRKYKIFETTHGQCVIPVEQKRCLPDRFLFVSPYHVRIFNNLGIPCSIIEYQAEPHIRPERTTALAKLGLNPEKRHILNVGLFTPGKNQAEIFEIAKKLPEIDFHFVGNQAPNFEHYWSPLMKEKPNNCFIWGERDDVDNFMLLVIYFYLHPNLNCFLFA